MFTLPLPIRAAGIDELLYKNTGGIIGKVAFISNLFLITRQRYFCLLFPAAPIPAAFKHLINPVDVGLNEDVHHAPQLMMLDRSFRLFII